MYRLMGKSDLMYADINSAFSYDKNIVSANEVLAKYEIMNCNFKLGIEYFTKIIEKDPTMIKGWLKRAEANMIIGEYDLAIEDYKKTLNLMKDPVMSVYQIGKCYYKIGNNELAREFYNKFLQTGKTKSSYETPDYSYGIVQHVNIEKGFGFIFGSTWSTGFDGIFFRLKNGSFPVKVGDRVRFQLSYNVRENLLKPIATKIELWNRISNPRFKKHSTYHGIIHLSTNAFRASSELKYLYIFYPHNSYYPLDSINCNIDNSILEKAKNIGYVFVEFNLIIDENECPNFSNIKSIPKENAYSYKFKKNTEREGSDSSLNYWNCNICGGNSSAGCQYFDPTECPKHT